MALKVFNPVQVLFAARDVFKQPLHVITLRVVIVELAIVVVVKVVVAEKVFAPVTVWLDASNMKVEVLIEITGVEPPVLDKGEDAVTEVTAVPELIRLP